SPKALEELLRRRSGHHKIPKQRAPDGEQWLRLGLDGRDDRWPRRGYALGRMAQPLVIGHPAAWIREHAIGCDDLPEKSGPSRSSTLGMVATRQLAIGMPDSSGGLRGRYPEDHVEVSRLHGLPQKRKLAEKDSISFIFPSGTRAIDCKAPSLL